MCDKSHYDKLCARMDEMAKAVGNNSSETQNAIAEIRELRRRLQARTDAEQAFVDIYAGSKRLASFTIATAKFLAALGIIGGSIYATYQAVVNWRP